MTAYVEIKDVNMIIFLRDNLCTELLNTLYNRKYQIDTNNPQLVPVRVRNIADQIDFRESHCSFHGMNVNMIATLIDMNIQTIVYNFVDIRFKILFLARKKDTNNDAVIIKNITSII